MVICPLGFWNASSRKLLAFVLLPITYRAGRDKLEHLGVGI